jgi:hypothetical protein
MEIAQKFVDRWRMRPSGPACYSQTALPWPCSHKFFMYHLIGYQLSLLLGIDPLSPLWIAALGVMEYFVAGYSAWAAVVAVLVGYLCGVAMQELATNRTKATYIGIYVVYWLISLLPLPAFFMSDVRMDTDIVGVRDEDVVPECLESWRNWSTKHYPLGMAMTGLIHTGLLILCIVIEVKHLSSYMVAPDTAGHLRAKIFYTVLVYGSAMFQTVVYTLLAMAVKIDVLWLYMLMLAISTALISMLTGSVRQAVGAVSRMKTTKYMIQIFFWPCMRSKQQ